MKSPFRQQTVSTETALPLAHPVTGDSMEILHSPCEANPTLRVRFQIAPQSAGAPPLHFHRVITETFRVEAGALWMQIGRETRQLHAGEQVTVLPGMAHRFWNPNPRDTVTFVTEVTPGADFERFLRGMYDLACSGRANAQGMPRELRHWHSLLRDADLWFPAVPVRLQKMARGLLRVLAEERQGVLPMVTLVPFF